MLDSFLRLIWEGYQFSNKNFLVRFVYQVRNTNEASSQVKKFGQWQNYGMCEGFQLLRSKWNISFFKCCYITLDDLFLVHGDM